MRSRRASVCLRVVTTRNQQVARIDHESDADVAGDACAALVASARAAVAASDAGVLSDYRKGVVCPAVIAAAIDEAAKRRVPLLVDPKVAQAERYNGASLITPNHHEAELMTQTTIRSSSDAARAARLLHERTGGVALKSVADSGRPIAAPRQVFCTMDHVVDTRPGRTDATLMPTGRDFIVQTRDAARAAGVTLFDIGDEDQGIVHVISPEQGIVLPGLTLVCPDSHTCTQGAFGALAWGIGSTEAALVAALAAGGVPPGPALQAVLVFRAVTFWAPVPVGLLACRTLRR